MEGSQVTSGRERARVAGVRVDLHCHSNHSDGSYPAAEVAQRAVDRAVELFCLTDHDSCDGFEATRAKIPSAIEGVELSCTDNDRTVHLLVYKEADSSTWQVMLDALKEQQRVRRERVHLIAERLNEIDVVFDPDALLATNSGAIGRPHVAEELLRLGHVRSCSEAFEKYLHDGGPGDVRVNRLGIEAGLELAKSAGGCVSLAHPHVHGNLADDLIARCKLLGLSGLEVYYGTYKSKQRTRWLELAQQHGLVATGGSDFHGAHLKQVTRLGVDLPDEAGSALFRWLRRDAPN